MWPSCIPCTGCTTLHCCSSPSTGHPADFQRPGAACSTWVVCPSSGETDNFSLALIFNFSFSLGHLLNVREGEVRKINLPSLCGVKCVTSRNWECPIILEFFALSSAGFVSSPQGVCSGLCHPLSLPYSFQDSSSVGFPGKLMPAVSQHPSLSPLPAEGPGQARPWHSTAREHPESGSVPTGDSASWKGNWKPGLLCFPRSLFQNVRSPLMHVDSVPSA